METAKIILEPHSIPVQIHPGLMDLDYGDWQGISNEEVKTRYPELYRLWKHAPHTVVFPNGESLGSARDRSLRVTQEVVEKHPGKVVLLAAHRVVNKVLIAALLGLDNSHFWEIGQDTAAINIFQYSEGKWICRVLNDTCHLHKLGGRSTLDF
jgi:broad specificity phosphatase PhoE